MKSKLCPHVQVLDVYTLETIRRVQPPMVKTMDLNRQSLQSIRQAAPSALIVARRYADDQDYHDARKGLAFAESYGDVLDLVDVVEVYNEAINNLSTMNDCRAFDAWQVQFARRVWELRPDVRIGLFCLPTGNFGYPGEPSLTTAWFPQSLSLPANRVFICLHEYSWYTWSWESPARCLRYRRLMGYLPGWRALITECGLTRAVLAGHPDVGWRTGVEREVFIEGARWYDAELQKDDYVVGAAMFTCGTSYGWDTFECTAEWEEAVRISAEKQPEFERPIRVLVGGQVRVMELEEYLRAVVPAEMPALWPMEALKAQAVLARTYARYAVAHPRGREFQLYGDARGQVWNPALKALSSTVAVNETEGVYLVDEKGNPAFVEYVSKCGREDCPYCLSKAGHVTAGNPDGVWPTRVCQWGMKTLAERGLLYEDIIRHYLPDARFVTAEEGTE